MPEYRRSYVPGGSYFFTLLTYQRRPIFMDARARDVMHASLECVQRKFPFVMVAVCLLPDHLHTIWTLPGEDQNYSLRWSEIKRIFSLWLRGNEPTDAVPEESRAKRREAAIWQRRFWEHTIRDESDFYNHLNYIHYNPVKHGLVKRVSDWPWSSFHRYVQMGWYEESWGDENFSSGSSSAYEHWKECE